MGPKLRWLPISTGLPLEFGNHWNLETTGAAQNSKGGGGGPPQGHSIIYYNII